MNAKRLTAAALLTAALLPAVSQALSLIHI